MNVKKELKKANEEINKQILEDGADVFEKLMSENEFDDTKKTQKKNNDN